MTDRLLNGSHRKQRDPHMRQKPRTSVAPTPMTDDQRHRARLTIARMMLDEHPDSRATQVSETRRVIDMLGLTP